MKTCGGKKEKNVNWKGKNASYAAKHIWAVNNFGKPIQCEKCGETKKKLNWANISGKFKRKRSDWLELCVSCHRKYDYKNGSYHTRGETHLWAKLNEKQIKEIREKFIPRKHKIVTDLAKEYGVAKSTIQHIVRRINWKH